MSDPRPSDYAMAIARKGAPLDEERVAFMLDAYAEMLVKRDRERIAIWLRHSGVRSPCIGCRAAINGSLHRIRPTAAQI